MSSSTLDPRRCHIGFLVILLGALLLRLSWYMGPAGADDMIYFAVVKKLLLGQEVGEAITTSMHWGIRLGMVLPLWGIMELFGVSELSSMLYPLLMSLGSLIFVYWAGCRLFTPLVGVLASGIYAILPLDVYYSGVMYPDGTVVLFSGLFLYLLYGLALEERLRAGQAVLAGLILGLAYTIRETSILLPVAALALLVRAPSKKGFVQSWCLVALGFLLILGLEMLILQTLTDDPFTRFKILTGKTNVLAADKHVFTPRFHSYFLDGVLVLFATYWIAPLMIPLVVAGAFLLIGLSRQRDSHSGWQSQLFWIFVMSSAVLLFFIYAPIIGFSRPLDRDERYYLIVMPFFVLLFSAVLVALYKEGGWRRPAALGCFVLYLSAAFFGMGCIVNKNSIGLEQIAEFITLNPAQGYILPAHLEPMLTLKGGRIEKSNRITTYRYGQESLKQCFEQAVLDGEERFLFYSPGVHRNQKGFGGFLEFPAAAQPFTKLPTIPSLSCRLLNMNKTVAQAVPAFFSSRICFNPSVHVYTIN